MRPTGSSAGWIRILDSRSAAIISDAPKRADPGTEQFETRKKIKVIGIIFFI